MEKKSFTSRFVGEVGLMFVSSPMKPNFRALEQKAKHSKGS